MRLAYSIWGLPIRPGQVRSEIEELLRIVLSAGPKCILEIGTGNGGTLFLFSRLPDASTLITIGLHRARFGNDYSPWKEVLYRSLARGDQIVVPLRANSHDVSTLFQVRSILGDKRVDFLFIDGDHTYPGAKADFETYSPLVREGGIVALHDILKHSEIDGCKVDELWDELKTRYPSSEIICRNDQGWAGIGVLYM